MTTYQLTSEACIFLNFKSTVTIARRPFTTTKSDCQEQAYFSTRKTPSSCTFSTCTGWMVWVSPLLPQKSAASSTSRLALRLTSAIRSSHALTSLIWRLHSNCPVKPSLIGLSLPTTWRTRMPHKMIVRHTDRSVTLFSLSLSTSLAPCPQAGGNSCSNPLVRSLHTATPSLQAVFLIDSG